MDCKNNKDIQETAFLNYLCVIYWKNWKNYFHMIIQLLSFQIIDWIFINLLYELLISWSYYYFVTYVILKLFIEPYDLYCNNIKYHLIVSPHFIMTSLWFILIFFCFIFRIFLFFHPQSVLSDDVLFNSKTFHRYMERSTVSGNVDC